MVLYHCTFAHDLTMESNLTLAVNFAAVPAGLGVHYLVTYTLAVRRRALALSLAAALAAASAAGAFHTVSILRDDRTWPDWRPVVAAAHEQGVASARSIWSTADNGGMRNTWGVRRAAPQLAGNVWQLRSEFGSAVDVGSPWVRWETVELLQLAARREIDFVIGPLPFRNLRVNERVHGFIVAAIVHVPNGEACYVLRNARSGM